MRCVESTNDDGDDDDGDDDYGRCEGLKFYIMFYVSKVYIKETLFGLFD